MPTGIHKRKQYRSFRALGLCFLSVLCLLSSCRTIPKSPEDIYTLAEFPPSPAISSTDTPLNYQRMKGVWVSYLEYAHYFKGKDQEEYEQQVDILLDDICERGLNTVILQVRSHGDAYYPSQYYPWSKYVTGSTDQSPEYDPLDIFLTKAHTRALSVHAWINPYRLSSSEELEGLSDSYLIRQWYQKADYMAQMDGYWYLNPGNSQVQKLILDGITELIEQYPVDGIQIDDYFYTVSPQTFGQTEEEAQTHTTELVRGIYQKVKARHPQLLFGVSPAGNYLTKPKSDTTQYTDLVTWCSQEGYLDFVLPQIYWAFDDPSAPFQTVLQKWESLTQESPVRLYIGLAAYKFADSTILKEQTAVVEASAAAEGYCYFRYDNLV